MSKWQVTLSTTEPFNYVGIVQVRQGNKNTETLEFTVVENSKPYNLHGMKVYFQAVINNYAVEEEVKIKDSVNGVFEYTFSDYSMQQAGLQTAYFQFRDENDQVIGSTQDFNYFVIRAASTTEGETGSYWQSVQDLIDDMKNFINANQGDFTEWFDSVKEILASIDPGGKILLELVEARYSIDETKHESLKERLKYDFNIIYNRLYALERYSYLECGEIEDIETVRDDLFSQNHEVIVQGFVTDTFEDTGLIIATIDDPKQGLFKFELVGVIDDD